MITITANARRATYKSDDLITSGSVGIPVEFILSDDFDGLSSVAVFEGSGTSVDVALMSDACVVPSEVVATAGGYLRIGVYARNGEGTIVIPTVWVSTQVILPGAEPSGVDPSQPTPDWTAQVQEAAAEALSIAQSIEQRANEGDFDGEQGPPGQDGFSPTATVTQTSTGATITVTDAEGTTTAEITNGQDGAPGAPGTPGTPGEDGISPTITVTDITGGHRVTITDATGPHSFDVMDGMGSVQDVQVAGTSVVQDGVANVLMASANDYGVIKVGQGLFVFGNKLNTDYATDANIKSGSSYYKPLTPVLQHYAAFYGLAKAAGDTTQSQSSNAVGNYTDNAKSAISQMLNGSVTVTGTTPSITALPGIRYVCGEVSTLDITLPASGIVDIVFESGSTATVLTVTPPTGVMLKWANGFDPTALDADTIYEINIADGLGVAASWT